MPRPTTYRICTAFALLPLAAACGTAARSPGQPSTLLVSTATQPSTRARSDIIEYSEIQAARVHNAHEAVARLRPEFLGRMAAPVPADPNGGLPIVYLDGIRQGGVDALRTIPIAPILEIRFLSAAAASDEFGPYYPGGVIAVRTRK